MLVDNESAVDEELSHITPIVYHDLNGRPYYVILPRIPQWPLGDLDVTGVDLRISVKNLPEEPMRQSGSRRISGMVSQLKRLMSYQDTRVCTAKRMHIEPRWGWKLPLQPTQKCRRKIYRNSVRRAVMHDRSYHVTYELRGLSGSLQALLDSLGSPPMRALHVRPAGQFVLLNQGRALGPCETIVCSTSSASEKLLWLTVHPTLTDTMERLLSELWSGSFARVPLSCFELIGPCALRHVARLLGSQGLSFLPEGTRRLLTSGHMAMYLLHQNLHLSFDMETPSILGPFPPRNRTLLTNSDPPQMLKVKEVFDDVGVFQWKSLTAVDTDGQRFRLTRRSQRRKPGKLLHAKLTRHRSSSVELNSVLLNDTETTITTTTVPAASQIETFEEAAEITAVEPVTIVLRRVGRHNARVQLFVRSGTIGRPLWT